MLVKSIQEDDHLDDLKETFNTLRSYKCAFGVMARKFLGFMVSQRGNEVNPNKIQAIMELTLPKKSRSTESKR